MSLIGGWDFPAIEDARRAWVARKSAVAPAHVEACLDRYGTSAERILQAGDGRADDELPSLPGYSSRELRAVVTREQVVDLTDLIFRRLPIAVSGQLNDRVVADLAGLAAETLQWSPEERERQVESLCRVAWERHGIDVGGRTGLRTEVLEPRAFS